MAPVAGVDKEQFLKRLSKLYSAWKDGKEDWENLDAIAIAVGVDEDTVYSKSTIVQTWLFGYELQDTIMLFTKNSVILLSSKKKIEFLKPAESKEENGNPSVKLLMRDKSDNDKANFQKLITALKESENGKRIGVFSKDKFPGAFMDSWRSSLQKENMEMVDLSTAVAQVLAVKDESELNIMKKAFQVSLDIFTKYLKDQVMDIVNGDRKIRHQELAEGVESAVSEKKYVSEVDPAQVDMCYPPIIQSGGNYSLKFSAVTDKNVLHFGSIVCCLGARYKSYCSNIVRTLLVNPNDKVQANYNFVCQVEEEILKLLVPGTKLSTVYNKTVEFAKKEKPELADKLTKSFGFVIGIEFREGALVIGPKCNCVVMKGMTFTVNIGLSDLKNDSATDDAGKKYSLFLGDTVVVAEEGPATPLIPSKKKMKSIGIFLKDEESDEEKKRLSLKTMLSPFSAHNVEDANTRLDLQEQISNLNIQINAKDKELDDRNARIHDLMLICDQIRAEFIFWIEESEKYEHKLKENEEKLSVLQEEFSKENRIRVEFQLICDQLRAELTAKIETSKNLERKLKEYEEKFSTMEEVLSNENRSRKYTKPVIPHSDVYRIHETPDDHNEWANSSHLLGRDAHKKKIGKKEKALRQLFLPEIEKSAGDKLVAADWEKLKSWIQSAGTNGIIIIPEKPATANKEGKPAVRLIIHKDNVCFLNDGRDYCYVVCTYPDCLSYFNTTKENPRCSKHYGPLRFGVQEIVHQDKGVLNIYSFVFTYSVEEDADDTKKKLRFDQGAQRILISGENSSWPDYKKKVNLKDKPVVLREGIFNTQIEAEKYLALIQTSLLLAKINGNRIQGKQFTIINNNINLPYKNELEFETFIHDEYKLKISCENATSIMELDPEFGRRAIDNDDKPGEDERGIYSQWDVNIKYGGRLNSEIQGGVVSQKRSDTTVSKYEKTMGDGYHVNDDLIIISPLTEVAKSEEIFNFSIYCAHLFKVKNPLSNDNFTCLNKEVKMKLIVNEWTKVQTFMNNFFKVDISLTNVA